MQNNLGMMDDKGNDKSKLIKENVKQRVSDKNLMSMDDMRYSV